eukprot:12887001-Prorocentrum_lima.AAC.1
MGLKLLQEGQFAKLCGVGFQGCLASCVDVVDSMLMGCSPSWKELGAGPFAAELQSACARLCQATTKVGIEDK